MFILPRSLKSKVFFLFFWPKLHLWIIFLLQKDRHHRTLYDLNDLKLHFLYVEHNNIRNHLTRIPRFYSATFHNKILPLHNSQNQSPLNSS